MHFSFIEPPDYEHSRRRWRTPFFIIISSWGWVQVMHELENRQHQRTNTVKTHNCIMIVDWSA